MKDPKIQHGKEYKALRKQGLSEEVAEKIVKASGEESHGNSTVNLESLDYDHLMELARFRKIKGISEMSEEQVVKALREQKTA